MLEERTANTIVNTPMRLGREANAEGVGAMTFARKARATQDILEVVEHDYGEDALIFTATTTTRRQGQSLEPSVRQCC